MEQGNIFYLWTLQLSSLSLRCVNQCAVSCDLSGKEVVFITTSRLHRKLHIHQRPLFTERERGKADSTEKVQFFQH